MDYAASVVLSEIVSARGLTLRDVTDCSQGQLRYNRVRDILNAEKAPVRVSEFALICEITGDSPITEFAKACQVARNIRSGVFLPQWEADGKKARTPSQVEIERPPINNDPLIGEFTAARENDNLEIKAVPRSSS